MTGDAIDPVELLEAALAIPSPSGREQDLASYLVGRMATFADHAVVDEGGNAVCRVGDGPLKVLFLGHIDTVPGEIPVRTEEGRLYGRGAVDAKGPFCNAVAAASRLPKRVRELLTVTLVGATEEEAPTSRGARYALTAYEQPDLLIVGEPSGWNSITLGYKGRLVIEAEVVKPNHHSAGSESSAAEDIVEVWNMIAGWADDLAEGAGIFDRVQATLQRIESRDDGLEQRCIAAIGLRLPPALPPEDARAALTEVLPSRPRYRFSGAEFPYRGPKDTVLTRAFRRAIRSHGGQPRFKVKTGTSDMNVVAPHWRVPMVAYGAGDSSLDHAPNEHVEVTDLRRAGDVLYSVLQLLAEGVTED